MKALIVAGLLAAALSASVMAGESEKFVAHEWGTFTSVQGQDGVQWEWNPYVAAELPSFVYDRNRPNHENNRLNFAVFAAKSAFMAKQRMETPVIYFYSPEKKSVDVRVNFPSGLMTEWYPHATSCDAERKLDQRPTAGKGSYLEWRGVKIAASQEGAESLPVEQRKSHYYPARETEASMLSIKNGVKGSVEREKFLFYRGVGHFEAPLKTNLERNGEMLALQNTGKENLEHLIVLQVSDGIKKTYRASRFDVLAKGQVTRVALDDLKEISRDELKTALTQSLEKEKLFAAEAKAMVKTWEESWLDETGVRVLYVLGGAWTDEVLPLTISPKPQDIVRVMVGRAEVITPAMEIALRDTVMDYARGSSTVREKAIVKARALGLGRFTDAVIRQLVKTNPGQEFSKAAFELAGKSVYPTEPKPVALK